MEVFAGKPAPTGGLCRFRDFLREPGTVGAGLLAKRPLRLAVNSRPSSLASQLLQGVSLGRRSVLEGYEIQAAGDLRDNRKRTVAY